MGATFLITLREGFEIALIVAILFAYLRTIQRADLFAAVWRGIGFAAVICVIVGALVYAVAGGLTGTSEVIVEMSLAAGAASVLTYQLFWMRRQARSIKGRLHEKLDSAVTTSTVAVSLFAILAVMREGLETVLLLLGTAFNGATPVSMTVGGFAGLAVAAWLGFVFYQGGRRFDIRRFFQVSGGLLILFAAGMFGKAAHELVELTAIAGPLAHPAWQVTSGPFASGDLMRLFAGVFGWSPHPELLRVMTYFAYLVPVTCFYFADGLRANLIAPLTRAFSGKARAGVGA